MNRISGPTLSDFPEAPEGAWISKEGWLIVGEEAWTLEEWLKADAYARQSKTKDEAA